MVVHTSLVSTLFLVAVGFEGGRWVTQRFFNSLQLKKHDKLGSPRPPWRGDWKARKSMEIHHSFKDTWLNLFFGGGRFLLNIWVISSTLSRWILCQESYQKPHPKKKPHRSTSFPIHFMLRFSSFQIFWLNPQAVLVLKNLKKFSAEGTDLKGGTKGQDIGLQGSWCSRCIRVR